MAATNADYVNDIYRAKQQANLAREKEEAAKQQASKAKQHSEHVRHKAESAVRHYREKVQRHQQKWLMRHGGKWNYDKWYKAWTKDGAKDITEFQKTINEFDTATRWELTLAAQQSSQALARKAHEIENREHGGQLDRVLDGIVNQNARILAQPGLKNAAQKLQQASVAWAKAQRTPAGDRTMNISCSKPTKQPGAILSRRRLNIRSSSLMFSIPRSIMA